VTVKELRELLEKYDDDVVVCTYNEEYVEADEILTLVHDGRKIIAIY